MNELIELELNGRIVRYTPEELSAILKSKFSGNPIHLPGTFKRLTVFPLEIDPRQFAEERVDPRQEDARCKIVYALHSLKQNPKKYGVPFEIFIPVNIESKSVRKLKEQYSEKLHFELEYSTDIDEFLRWGFMIQKGIKTWEQLCNEPDDAMYPRIILKDGGGSFYTFGGGRMVGKTLSATYVDYRSLFFGSTKPIQGAVPQLKRYLSSSD